MSVMALKEAIVEVLGSHSGGLSASALDRELCGVVSWVPLWDLRVDELEREVERTGGVLLTLERHFARVFKAPLPPGIAA